MSTILVTGGAGFIGSHLIERLLKERSITRVVCVDNLDDSYSVAYKKENLALFRAEKKFKFCRVDIRDARKLRRVFVAEKPDFVVHLAAKTDTRMSLAEPGEYESVNFAGTLNVLECAKDVQAKKCITISSSSVYGNAAADRPVAEDAVTDFPLSHYGATKKAGEVLAHSYFYNYGMTILCLRLFNVYGERMRPGPVLYTWVDSLLRDKPLTMSGKGERRRDFTYVGDVVDAISKAIKKGKDFAVLNVSSSRPVALSELLRVVEEAAGKQADVTFRKKNRASIESSYGDISKATRMLGWKPSTPLESGVRRFVAWFREHRLEHSLKRP